MGDGSSLQESGRDIDCRICSIREFGKELRAEIDCSVTSWPFDGDLPATLCASLSEASHLGRIVDISDLKLLRAQETGLLWNRQDIAPIVVLARIELPFARDGIENGLLLLGRVLSPVVLGNVGQRGVVWWIEHCACLCHVGLQCDGVERRDWRGRHACGDATFGKLRRLSGTSSSCTCPAPVPEGLGDPRSLDVQRRACICLNYSATTISRTALLGYRLKARDAEP